ncbi:TadE/TadG family type IV pilus assembly protein [Streptomyces sp. H10-C2]|uniref:TadE/TadG family type IV pilus assembly protein n=1 Tax=unclassified Streptomyces TaxID=2593676 RepID=UPI0024B99454|nr:MULTISPECIES: TadE/TadG family type IV pilus assembly protein [unclassified Streptomyces]MDJ0342479.1 TadE/TadG family type IV pilus assembly protein [Streptomyces sp. PH10-H1]MDJ0372334.1 TadE/TadG family type IV pilus assembly protein [Streptomyces sp. H10-C2]
MRAWLRTRAQRTGDEGVSTIEVVILAPVMFLFILVLVAFGQMVDGRGGVDGAARDAARAGSLQRDSGSAMREAKAAAEADLTGTCVEGSVRVATRPENDFRPGRLFAIDVTCEVRGLAMLGLNIKTTMTGSAASPLDPYRRMVQ